MCNDNTVEVTPLRTGTPPKKNLSPRLFNTSQITINEISFSTQLFWYVEFIGSLLEIRMEVILCLNSAYSSPQPSIKSA